MNEELNITHGKNGDHSVTEAENCDLCRKDKSEFLETFGTNFDGSSVSS